MKGATIDVRCADNVVRSATVKGQYRNYRAPARIQLWIDGRNVSISGDVCFTQNDVIFVASGVNARLLGDNDNATN